MTAGRQGLWQRGGHRTGRLLGHGAQQARPPLLLRLALLMVTGILQPSPLCALKASSCTTAPVGRGRRAGRMAPSLASLMRRSTESISSSRRPRHQHRAGASQQSLLQLLLAAPLASCGWPHCWATGRTSQQQHRRQQQPSPTTAKPPPRRCLLHHPAQAPWAGAQQSNSPLPPLTSRRRRFHHSSSQPAALRPAMATWWPPRLVMTRMRKLRY